MAVRLTPLKCSYIAFSFALISKGMIRMAEHDIDEVGYWTEMKLNILREYAHAYSTILNKHDYLEYAYIDGFAGAGAHKARRTGEEIDGSPVVALNTSPTFSEYHFIDLDEKRTEYLSEITNGQENVSVYTGDGNEVLTQRILPECKYEDYKRALCVLDPYNLNPNWEVVRTAGAMGSIEIFLNFMIMDANMNVLWNNPEKVTADQKRRMDVFWGDESWREAAYDVQQGLFDEDLYSKRSNLHIVEAYKERLHDEAGFQYVAEPFPMINTSGAPVYYLFFASNNQQGKDIAQDIFNKWKKKGFDSANGLKN